MLRAECGVLQMLAVLVEAKTIVEVGVMEGHTSIFLARAAQLTGGRYIGFDVWDRHGQAGQFPQLGSKALVEKRLEENGFSGFLLVQIDTIAQRGEWETRLDEICPAGIDFSFIDACHSYKGLANDFSVIYPRLTAAGVIVFHDTAKIDGCREFVLDLRTKYYDGTFDIIDLPFGGDEQRNTGISILVKRALPMNQFAIDEVCGSLSSPADIERREAAWYAQETEGKLPAHKTIPKELPLCTLSRAGAYASRRKFEEI